MKRKIAIAATILFTLVTSSVSADPSKNVVIDGQTVLFDQKPIVTRGVTMVQFTPVFNKLGITSSWDQKKKQVTARKNGTKIVLTVGSKNAYINGKRISLEVSPVVIEGKVFVPLRLISESTGAKLIVRDHGNTIEITSTVYNSEPEISSSVVTPTPTPTQQSSENPTSSTATNEQIETYLNSKYSKLRIGEDSYDVKLTTLTNSSGFSIGIHMNDMNQISTIIKAPRNNLSYIFKLTKDLAKDLYEKYNKEDFSVYIYLSFDAPIYPEPFNPENITSNTDGTYHLKQPLYLARYNYLEEGASFYAIDLDDNDEQILFYEAGL